MFRKDRAYFRRLREVQHDPHRPRWFDVPEDPELDGDDEAQQDAFERLNVMMKFDAFDREWRALANEYGFTWAMKAKQAGHTVKFAAEWLKNHRRHRQWSNPNGTREELSTIGGF